MRLSDAAVARGVSYRYGDVPALAESSFTIPEGAVTTLIGPNGAGKSTLLHAIAGLIAPASGSLEVVGERRIADVLQGNKVNEALPVTVLMFRPLTQAGLRMRATQVLPPAGSKVRWPPE